MMKVTNTTLGMLMDNRKKGVMLSQILKSGKPGKPRLYETVGHETAADVIDRLEKLNPGYKWIEA